MAQKININTTPGQFMPTLYYSQGDIGRTFELALVSSDGWTVPAGATVEMVATKPSGFGFTVSGTLADGVATFVTTETMTNEWGRFPAEIRITSGGVVIGTANFYLNGEKDPHPADTIDGDASEIISELTLLVERVETAASSVLDMTVNANTLAAGSQATYSYDEETNTATFGIPQGEAGAGSTGVVASAYSASKTYAVGDYVIHNSNLYRCTTAITTAESFTAGHWTQVVLADDVTDVKSALTNLPVTSATFTALTNSHYSDSKNRIAVNIKAGEKYYTYIEQTGTRDYRYVILFADGTSTSSTWRRDAKKQIERTADAEIIGIGIEVATDVGDSDFTFTVVRNPYGYDLVNNLSTTEQNTADISDISNNYSANPITSVRFAVSANSSHSASRNRLLVNVKAGDKFRLIIKQTSQRSYRFTRYYSDGTSDTSAFRTADYESEITANKNVISIGIEVATGTSASEFYAAVFQEPYGAELIEAFSIIEKKCSQDAANPFVGSWFATSESESHSSNKDNVKTNIKSGEKFFVYVRVVGKSSYRVFAGPDSPSTGYGSIRTIENGSFLETFTATSDIGVVGIYTAAETPAGSVSFVVIQYDKFYKYIDYLNNDVYIETDYYRSQKAEDFAELYNNTDDIDSFFFFTDPHIVGINGSGNGQMDLRKMRKMFERLKGYADENAPNAIISGGDWLIGEQTAEAAIYALKVVTGFEIEYFSNFNYHGVLGNHEHDPLPTPRSYSLPQKTLDNIMYQRNGTGKAYFSFSTLRTQYICLDTGSDVDYDSFTDYRKEQVIYAASLLQNPEKENIVFVMHITSVESVENFANGITAMAREILNLAEAFNNRSTYTFEDESFNFADSEGTIRFILSGHKHYDYVWYDDDGLPIVMTTDATNYLVSPVIFDMCVANYTTGKLNLTRVGNEGTNREVNMKQLT